MRKKKIYLDLKEFSCNKLDVSQEEILLRSDWRIDMSEGEFTGLKKKNHQHRG